MKKRFVVGGMSILLTMLLVTGASWAQQPAPVPFDCTGQAFIVQDQPVGEPYQGQLTAVDQSVTPFTFTDVGGPQVEYNNIGFRSTDGFIYGVELTASGNNGIVRIDSSGTATNLGTPAGLPNVRFDAGDVSTDGNTLFVYWIGSSTILYEVDLTGLPTLPLPPVSTRTVTGLPSSPAPDVRDWAFREQDGNLYGGNWKSGNLAMLDLGTAGQAAWNEIQLKDTGGSNTFLPTGVAYGGAWANAAGGLFIYQNDGEIYTIDMDDPDGPTILGMQTGPGSSRNDAAACAADVGCLDPIEYDLFAGQDIYVGSVSIGNDDDYVYVIYRLSQSAIDDGWSIVETHLAIEEDCADMPMTKTGNPKVGHFPYFTENYPGVPEVIYPPILLADLGLTCESILCIAAHAVVERVEENCIDFDQYNEKNEVGTESTDAGDVEFYMTGSLPLVGLELGDTAALTPAVDAQTNPILPIVAEPLTRGDPPDDTNIVAFTVNMTRFGGGSPYTDDYIRDDNGTGAFDMTLTDPQDLTQVALQQHALSQFLAIVIDVTEIADVRALDLAAIDLDFGENWTFQFFNAAKELIHTELLNETVLSLPAYQGDGKAFPVGHTDEEIAYLAIWGGDNSEVAERIGYAIDNVCVTSVVQEETAWADDDDDRNDFPGRNWATRVTYEAGCCE